MAFSNKISLIDIATVQDASSGKTTAKIVKETIVYADLQEVGLQEYYSAYGNKQNLIATYEIPAHMYHGERFILANNRTEQYEITRAAKGRSKAYLRLPVIKVSSRNFLLEGVTSG